MKFKNNIYKLLALGLLVTPIAFTSCSEDRMDEINFNPNNPLDVEAKFILADVITSTAVRSVGGDLNSYLSSYVEHEVGVYNQLWNAEHRDGEPQTATTFNNSWNSIYETAKNARIVVEKCSEGGSQEGNFATLGVGQILLAYNLAILTDMYGDIPYSEAFNPFENKTPKLDKQEALYSEIMTLLDAAIDNIPKGDTHGSGVYNSHDLLFRGDNGKWIKFAHGLKARYTMRLLNVTSNETQALEDVIEFVENSFSSATEEAAFNVYDAQNLNPLFDFQWSVDLLGASKSIADKFIERNDPRRNRNFTNADWVQVDNMETGSNSYGLLAPNGESEQKQYSYLTSTFVFSQTASTLLLSYHELQFLKAEAMARLNRSTADIEPVLKTAIEAAINNSEKSVETAFVAPALVQYGGLTKKSPAITVTDIDSYFEDEVKPLFQANPLKEIAVQKYLAFFGASGESTETYNDIRRWKALGEDLIELKNPNNASKFPLRLPYGASETTTNPNVEAAYGNGTYVYSENVWWAGGTR
ncbi:SusD/RagB family nutrient-binding outer membrane lipoprotein [Sphingobacterium sp. DN00404]|uniref:SusD/RagB family nutrient-binding outer membrane lipoprotein n=1 Tax=Sphingobacterium micropteri TaxID=2763501 RepID=A0ABR7YTS8_9SPHI|nr:SusD/RagB family nutrient-binding outer membrane lipoprotein [Sphingobacterium micropteri]MBD1434657.1 SusD/RagB family nutrient-binding outer membrane lipoprotein [Sphingobacterium micropteri]